MCDRLGTLYSITSFFWLPGKWTEVCITLVKMWTLPAWNFKVRKLFPSHMPQEIGLESGNLVMKARDLYNNFDKLYIHHCQFPGSQKQVIEEEDPARLHKYFLFPFNYSGTVSDSGLSHSVSSQLLLSLLVMPRRSMRSLLSTEPGVFSMHKRSWIF